MTNLPNLSEIMSLRNTEKSSEQSENCKIHILSFSTFQPVDIALHYFLSQFDIHPSITIGAYDQVVEDALFTDTIMDKNPNIIYIHASILKFFIQTLSQPKDAETDSFKQILEQYYQTLKSISERFPNINIIANTLEYVPFRICGTLSSVDGHIRHIKEVNHKITELSINTSNLSIHDVNYISSQFGLVNWFDYTNWAMFKQPFSSNAIPNFAASLASVIASLKGKTMKILATDLDNTLWGGIIGDVGVENIHLGPNSPKGELYSIVQAYLKNLKSSGIPIGINSKNNESIARQGFDKEDSILNFNDFSASKINWDPKSQNLHTMLDELNLRAAQCVFIDDNPAEIHEINQSIPECKTISYNKSPIELLESIDQLGYFESQFLSKEDFKRNEYYSNNNQRNNHEKQFSSKATFLESLKMTSKTRWDSKTPNPRLSQLISKTNQFNLTQITLNDDALNDYFKNPNLWCCYTRLTDIFGDNGIVSIAFGRIADSQFIIENWVMSCRVFNRTLEDSMMQNIIERATMEKCTSIVGTINILDYNTYCHNLFHKLNFNDVTPQTALSKEFFLPIDGKPIILNNFIEKNDANSN